MGEFDILVKGFNNTLDLWRQQLEKYNYQEICTKPDDKSWLIGQIVSHLIEETTWYLERINICLENEENTEKTISPEIEKWFERNSFPIKRFKGPPDLPVPAQPQSKEAMFSQFDGLIAKIRFIGKEISLSESNGRAQHPGHGYLNAKEWFQYAEMHMRHHFRQKERIDDFLEK